MAFVMIACTGNKTEGTEVVNDSIEVSDSDSITITTLGVDTLIIDSIN